MAEPASVGNLLSAVLSSYQSARQEKFTSQHPVAVSLQNIAAALETSNPVLRRRTIKVVASAGKGNWAQVPWIALLDERETTTTQRGVYVVFLFRADMTGVYLTFNQGVTEPKEKLGRPIARKALELRAQAIQARFPELAAGGFSVDGGIDLGVDGLGADYESSTINYKFLPTQGLPNDTELFADIGRLLDVYEKYLEDPIPLALSATGTWIFQANPDLWDLHGAVRKLKALTWLVKQHADRIRAGDKVYLWQSGREGGLVAVAEVLTEPAEIEGIPEEQEFALEASRFAGKQLRVRLAITKVLPSPISRAELLADAELAKLSILEQPLGTNFPVSVEEAKALAALVERYGERAERITLVEAARRVLAENGKPMKSADIWGEINARRLFESKGKTPEQTVHAVMLRSTLGVETSSSVAKRLFYRAGPATFGLLEWLTEAERRALEAEEQEIRGGVVDATSTAVTESVLDLPDAVRRLTKAIDSAGYVFEPWQVATYVTALRTKPFVILAGVSGTGKSRLPALVSKFTGGREQLFPVRPDWSDSSEVLGYLDLQGEFRPGTLLKFAREAESNPTLHHVCIVDEMNLARVEQYFAEVLSRMEDRDDLDGAGFVSGPLLALALEHDDARWRAQRLPSNLGIVGTVNMDESTHGFSRKVLDRAFTIEVSDIELARWEGSEEEVLQISPWPVSAWRPRAIRLGNFEPTASERATIENAIAVLTELNGLLVQAQLQVGYRVRDEIALFLVHAAELPGSFVTRHGETVDALDIALQMKVLPRIAGGSASVRNLVLQLLGWATDGSRFRNEDEAATAMSAWREAGRPSRIADARYQRTAARLALMWERLLIEGYTSFWL